jgi:hypothetical protein
MKISRENEMDITTNYIMKLNDLRLEEQKLNKESERINNSKETSKNDSLDSISTISTNNLESTSTIKKRVLKKK